ncbi:hypothetical protein C0993_003920 [Termitomyces sp. T159_Od127]|nr:hypothetical protein C0993_003920 [Termitomyces sp. T159_Od127]
MKDPSLAPVIFETLSKELSVQTKYFVDLRADCAKGAITASDTQYKLSLELKDALGLPHERFESPYDKRSRPLVEYTAGLRALGVPEQLSVVEAALLYEV